MFYRNKFIDGYAFTAIMVSYPGVAMQLWVNRKTGNWEIVWFTPDAKKACPAVAGEAFGFANEVII